MSLHGGGKEFVSHVSFSGPRNPSVEPAVKLPIMRSQRLAQKLPLVIPVVLVLLLAGLATLQYHWSGKVSVLERQRMRASLFVAGSHFSEDFDREVTRVFLFFHPEPRGPAGGQLDRVARQYDHWMAEAPYPRLVRDVFLIRPGAGSDEKIGAKGTGIEILRPAEHRFVLLPLAA